MYEIIFYEDKQVYFVNILCYETVNDCKTGKNGTFSTNRYVAGYFNPAWIYIKNRTDRNRRTALISCSFYAVVLYLCIICIIINNTKKGECYE